MCLNQKGKAVQIWISANNSRWAISVHWSNPLPNLNLAKCHGGKSTYYKGHTKWMGYQQRHALVCLYWWQHKAITLTAECVVDIICGCITSGPQCTAGPDMCIKQTRLYRRLQMCWLVPKPTQQWSREWLDLYMLWKTFKFYSLEYTVMFIWGIDFSLPKNVSQ